MYSQIFVGVCVANQFDFNIDNKGIINDFNMCNHRYVIAMMY